MPDTPPNPREDDIWAGDRRMSRPDSALPDWYLPDASFRPIPIAWFAGALVIQVIAMPVIFTMTERFGALVVILASALVSAGIGLLTWRRGISSAPRHWKIATFVMLGFFLGLNVMVALA